MEASIADKAETLSSGRTGVREKSMSDGGRSRMGWDSDMPLLRPSGLAMRGTVG